MIRNRFKIEEPRSKLRGFSSVRNFIVYKARLDPAPRSGDCGEHSVQDSRFKTFIVTRNLQLAAIILLFAVFSSCSSAVQYNLAPDYNVKMPNTVAVLPVEGYEEHKDVQYLLRTMVQDKFIQMGYSSIPLEAVDAKLIRSDMRREQFRTKASKELAALIGADSILYTTISEWDNTLFLSYASQKIEVKFELHGASGELLWEAAFNTKDSDMGLERDVIELGVIKAYEPVIQRIIDAVFSTLPDSKVIAKGSSNKRYYDWLP